METDNVKQHISTFEDGQGKLLDNHSSSAVDCSNKSTYRRHPSPVCFADPGGQKLTQPVTSVEYDEVHCVSSPELIRSDEIPGSFFDSVEHERLIVNDKCFPILSSSAECVVAPSLVQNQKNAAMTSIPSFLLNCAPGDQLLNIASVLNVEKEPMEIDDDYDDVDDRPLVLDLKATVDTSPPVMSPSVSNAVVFSEEAQGTFRRPLPPLKASPKVNSKALTGASLSTTAIVNPTSTRVQKPIRPFIPQHFNSLDRNSGCHAPPTVSASLAHHLAVPPPLGATTFRLQPHPSGPLALSAAVGPQQTNGVQFMSILTPPPHSISSAVSPSPIHLFDLNSMPGYLTPSVFFQPIPSAAGVQPAPPGSFQFAPPPPPLFTPHAFPPPLTHFVRASSNLPVPNSHTHIAEGLPPPPTLAPAPGLTRTPLAGLVIPDMSAWMAGAQPIPPLQPQPLLSAPPVPITTVTITSGEVLYSTVSTTAAPLTTPTFAITKSSSSAPKPLIPLSATPSSLAVTTSLKSCSTHLPTSMTVSDVAITSTSNFSISARRWRPSFRRKNATNSATVDKHPSTSNIDKAPTAISSTHTTTLTTTMSKSSMVDTEASPIANSLVATVEESLSKAGNENLVLKRRKANTSLAKYEAMDTALTKEGNVEKEMGEKNQLPVPLPSSPPKYRPHPSKRTLQPSSPLSRASTTERKIISHFIDGHVLYESNIQFPIRNAMAIVRAVLKSNGSTKSCDVVSMQPVNIDATKTPANYAHSSAIVATTGLAQTSTHWQHSVGLSPRGHRTRHLFKVEGSSGRETNAKIGDEVVKKKRRKKSLTVYSPTGVASGDTVTPMPPLNGHKEVAAIVGGFTKSRLAIPIATKALTAAEPMLPRRDRAAVSSSESIKTTTTATASISGGSGGIGLGLKVKIHPVYPSGSEGGSCQAAPTATASITFPSVVTSASNSLSSPSSSSVSTTVVSAVPQSCVVSAASCVHYSTVMTPTQTTSICSDGGSSCASPHRLSPLLSRGLIKSWSPCAVANFVRGTPSCADYADAFVENEIDGEALLLLTPAHFIKPPICMKIGHALKFAHRIRQVLDLMPNPIDETDSGDTGTE